MPNAIFKFQLIWCEIRGDNIGDTCFSLPERLILFCELVTCNGLESVLIDILEQVTTQSMYPSRVSRSLYQYCNQVSHHTVPHLEIVQFYSLVFNAHLRLGASGKEK